VQAATAHGQPRARTLADDIDEHMSAFNVEEFVQEYEKEILQRLTRGHESSRDAQVSDPRATLKTLSI